MIIDDDEVSNFVGTNILERSKIADKVLTFQSAGEALGYLRKHKDHRDELPKLLFLDINMPEMNGWDFIMALRNFIKLKNKIPIVILTSSIHSRDVDKARSFNEVIDFTSKPLTVEAVKSIEDKHFGH